MTPQNQLTNYYVTQAGGGQFYVGLSHQKGYGIGSWLGGLFRSVFPLLRSGATAVGKEAIRAGGHILADVARGQNLKSSAKAHAREAVTNLKRRATAVMQGRGSIKRRRTPPKRHSAITARRKQSYTSDKLS